VREDLPTLSYADLRTFTDASGTPRSKRAQIRYLAALLPDLTIPQLAEALQVVLSNDDLNAADLRIILDGRQLNDASKKTSEVPVEAIQQVGRTLANGGALLAAARAASVSVDTVVAIDEYLGLTERYEERLLDLAATAAHEGWSVRQLAKVSGMSKSRAHRYLTRARAVLVELGEVVS
jgi:hypothetical protein